MPILNEFHSVKRGDEVREFRLSNYPQNAKIIIPPVMKVTATNLNAIPGKCYLIHAISMSVLNGAGNTGTYGSVVATPYDGSSMSILKVYVVPSVANQSTTTLTEISLLTKPNTAVNISYTDCGAGSAIIYYSEVDIIDG